MKINVLIIEDDFRIGHIHQEMLEELSFCHVVETALNAKDALNYLATATILPDVILLDIYIPDVKGLELLEKLRTTYPYISIIIASADNHQKTIQAAKRIGVYDFLLKPIDKKRLQASFIQYQKTLTLTFEEWRQENIDQLFHDRLLNSDLPSSKEKHLPKGIDKLTLDEITYFLSKHEAASVTAQTLVEEIGVSRSTARRYLEYLDALDIVQATLHYGQVGRPQRIYLVREQNEQN